MSSHLRPEAATLTLPSDTEIVEFRNGHLQSGMEHGMNESYERADEVLESLGRTRR